MPCCAGGASASYEVAGSRAAATGLSGSDEADRQEGKDGAVPLGATRIPKRLQRYVRVYTLPVPCLAISSYHVNNLLNSLFTWNMDLSVPLLFTLPVVVTFACPSCVLARAYRKVAARYNEVEQRKERASRLDRMVEHLSLKRALMVRECLLHTRKPYTYPLACSSD